MSKLEGFNMMGNAFHKDIAFSSHNWSEFAGLKFALKIEENFNAKYHQEWFARNWWWALLISSIYVISIFAGQNYMKNRKPFNLRGPLAVWSLLLGLFSICGTLRVVPEFLDTLINRDMYHFSCINSFRDDVRVEFWMWLFTWSKIFEFGDTAFIVLRKQKLIALHWVHHMITFTYCFYAYGEVPSTVRYCIAVNYTVHSLMYTYYALRAMRVPVPKFVAIFITTFQIVQMFFGVYVHFFALVSTLQGKRCDSQLLTTIFGCSMMTLYLLMFLHFFFNTYMRGKQPRQEVIKKSE